MAHNVTCVYCKGKFDRDKIEYVQISPKRYAHAACSLRESQKNPLVKTPEIINPLDNVICIYCKRPLNRKDENCAQVSNGKYAHKECVEIESTRELTEKEQLFKYIMQLFKEDYVSAKIQKQINEYISEYNYTYSGIQKALEYFYDIKGNSIEKSYGGIGIVPHIYKQAYNYHYNLWLAKQKNEDKIIEEYIPNVVEIRIKRPERKPKKRKLFSFLDNEEELHGK